MQTRGGNRTPFTAPRNLYRTADDKWIAMSGWSQNTALRVLQLIGGEEVASDPRFATSSARVEHVDELDAHIGDRVSKRTRSQALELLEKAEAATGPVYDVAEIVGDEHLREREAFVRYNGVLMQGLIAKLSPAPGSRRRSAPAKGEHTAQVLGDLQRRSR